MVSEGLLAGLRVPKTGVVTTVGHTGLQLIAFSLGKKETVPHRQISKVKIKGRALLRRPLVLIPHVCVCLQIGYWPVVIDNEEVVMTLTHKHSENIAHD